MTKRRIGKMIGVEQLSLMRLVHLIDRKIKEVVLFLRIIGIIPCNICHQPSGSVLDSVPSVVNSPCADLQFFIIQGIAFSVKASSLSDETSAPVGASAVVVRGMAADSVFSLELVLPHATRLIPMLTANISDKIFFIINSSSSCNAI